MDNMTETDNSIRAKCQVCNFQAIAPNPDDVAHVRGNTERFLKRSFRLWKCPQCLTIYSLDPIDYADVYSDYPLNKRRLDVFARGTMRNLLRRLKRAGLNKTDRILDYGCGNGVFIQFLEENGYSHVAGYDPYVSEFSELDEPSQYDCVVANDVIEHCDDARGLLVDCARLTRPGGLLYVGTADSKDVDMRNLKPHIMRLHQPFHRIIMTEETLVTLGIEAGMHLIGRYSRSYMDTLVPFANYRFLDELNKKLGHNLNQALNPTCATKAVVWNPRLWFYALLGYFFPSANEPAIILRKPLN